MVLTILPGDNTLILPTIPSESVRLVYVDPPFNTGKEQRSHQGSYQDSFEDFGAWLKPKLLEVKRILTGDGSFFLHLDYREIHYAKVLADEVFGRASFMNESSGRTITVEGPRPSGLANTTPSSGMPRIPRATSSTLMPWIGFPIWLQAW